MLCEDQVINRYGAKFFIRRGRTSKMGRPNKGEKYHLIREGAHKRLVADKDFYCHGILIRAGKCGGRVDFRCQKVSFELEV